MLNDIITFLKSLAFIDYVFFFTVVFLIILVVSLIYFIKINSNETDELTDNLILSTRNLENVMLLSADEINTYDIVASDKMVITEKALKQVEEALK